MSKQSAKWFKAKKYGWGWYPATWQGWAILAGYVLLVTTDFLRVDTSSNSIGDTLLNFLPEKVILTLLLIAICYKTGEKPRWRWGK